jgi:hypothetical protein
MAEKGNRELMRSSNLSRGRPMALDDARGNGLCIKPGIRQLFGRGAMSDETIRQNHGINLGAIKKPRLREMSEHLRGETANRTFFNEHNHTMRFNETLN